MKRNTCSPIEIESTKVHNSKCEDDNLNATYRARTQLGISLVSGGSASGIAYNNGLPLYVVLPLGLVTAAAALIGICAFDDGGRS